MRILITRPDPDAARTAEAMTARGWVPILGPLFAITPLNAPDTDLTDVAALAFTSANGVRAFAAASTERGLPVYAVGAVTAAEAEAAGFDNVEAARGDVSSLARLIEAEAKPEEGRILHPVGRRQAGDLAGVLKQDGFEAEARIFYNAAPVETLPDTIAARLEATPITADWATFFSPRTMQTFARLVDEAGLIEKLGDLKAACLSEAVAAAGRDAPFAKCIVAEGTREDALLDAIAAEDAL